MIKCEMWAQYWPEGHRVLYLSLPDGSQIQDVIQSLLMAAAVEILRPYPNIELIWASPRELLSIFQADAIGCHIITVTSDILKKIDLVGKDLHEFSLDTVRMFWEDAVKTGYAL